MDPHKSGTLNHPPPAHNMSGPPQHPPHGLPMGQPMAPRALQPGYMAPRPAHTGSSVPIPSKSQPSVLGPKQPHPGGSSSPKPLLPPSSTPPLDKTSMMGGSPKPPATSLNVLSNSQVGGNKVSAPSLTQSSASKTVPNLPQTQYHHLELLQHQQTPQHMQQQQQQQPVSTHPQLNVSQQQMVMNQQHQSQHSQQQSQTNQQVSQQHHHQPLQPPHQQQQVVQQQGNTHCSASAQQICQNLPPKAPAAPTLGVVPKADATKGPTPPVPDLISIKQPPPTSQPMPASPTLKPPSFENKVTSNQSLVSKIFQPESNNSSGALSPAKSIQNVNTTNTPHSGGIGFPSQASLSRSSETPKPPNVSITPAKPVSIGQKPDFNKVIDSANTVTITPSLKYTENQEPKSNEGLKVSTDINAQTVANAGPNQNGVSTAKVSPKSPVSNTKLPETVSNEKMLASGPFPAAKMPASAPAASPVTSGQQAKVTQSPVSKQVSGVPVSKHTPSTQTTTSPKSSSIGKLSQVPAPIIHPNQEEESTVSSMPLSPKPSQKAPSSKLLSSLPIPSSTVSASIPKPSSPITTVSPSQSTVSSSAASKPQIIASPREVSVPAATTGTAPSQKRSLATSAPPAVTTPPEKVPKPEAVSKTDATTPTAPIAKREVGRFPRIRKPLNEKETSEPKGASKQTKEPAFDSMNDDDNEEEEEEAEIGTLKKRANRAKRKTSDTPSEGERRSKRIRNPASVYQSPVPDTLSRLTKSLISTPKTPQEKLVYFFKNEHVALRNAEGTFYLCQIAQNVYKNTRKIKIRWLSPIEEGDEKCETYRPDYYDVTDFDCILTTVALQKSDQKSFLHLPDHEKTRIMNILRRAIDRDRGIPQEKSELNEDHPDGLDLSLYNDESQLKKRKRKTKGKEDHQEMSSAESSSDSEEEKDLEEQSDNKEEELKASPVKSAPETDPQRRTRGGAPPKKAPLIVPSKKPVAASASPLPLGDSTPTITSQSPSSRRGVRTFGSSKSVTRGARVAATPVQSSTAASPVSPLKKDVSPNAASTKTDPSPKDQEPSPKSQRGRRSGQKTPVVKEAPMKESTPTPKTTRRSRK